MSFKIWRWRFWQNKTLDKLHSFIASLSFLKRPSPEQGASTKTLSNISGNLSQITHQSC